MNHVFLVQSVSTDVFKKLAKEGVKTNEFDCFTQVITYFVCISKQAAVNDCRKYNRKKTDSRYFVNTSPLY